MRRGGKRVLPVVAGMLLLSGCSAAIGGALGSAGGSFGSGVGNAIGAGVGRAVGDRIAAGVANRLPRVMTPDLTNFYIGYLFSVAFHSGSYSLEEVPYNVGDWTRWHFIDDGDGSAEFERAFLGRTAEGGEWWRVRYTTTDGKEKSEMVLEGLFSEDKTQLVRLRALMPDSKEPTEMPIQEGTFGYVRPIPLTAESIEGATVGVERISVPAGGFEARHVRYGSLSGGNLDWWLVKQVPGGMVKYTVRDTGENTASAVELTGHGKGAKSELGVKM